MKKALYIILAIICFIIPFFSWIPSISQGIEFDTNCGDYLRLSADANSIEIAEKQLTKAIDYLEKTTLQTDTQIYLFITQKMILVCGTIT